MIEQVLNLFQQFKERKKADDIVMGAGDRELTGALAIATAINRLADTIAEFKPFVEAAVESYLSEQTYECGGEEIEVSSEDMQLVQRLLSKRHTKAGETTDEDTLREAPPDTTECDNCENIGDECSECIGGSRFMPRDCEGSE